jgi:UDP-N-acetylglucosamine acyltransferase
MSIHPSAIVDSSAEIGPDVAVGPFCIVGGDVRLARGVTLDSHVVIYPGTTVGEGSRVYPNAVLGGDPQSVDFDTRMLTKTTIGAGCLIREAVTVHRSTAGDRETTVGDGSMLMANSHIGHDCRIGRQVVVTSYAGISGHCTIDDYAVIGGFVGIHQKVRVGTMAMVAGWSRVTTDCPPYTISAGVPCEPHSLNLVALKRRGVSPEARAGLKSAFRLLYRSDLNMTQAFARVREEIPACPEVESLLDFLSQVTAGAMGRGLGR